LRSRGMCVGGFSQNGRKTSDASTKKWGNSIKDIIPIRKHPTFICFSGEIKSRDSLEEFAPEILGLHLMKSWSVYVIR